MKLANVRQRKNILSNYGFPSSIEIGSIRNVLIKFDLLKYLWGQDQSVFISVDKIYINAHPSLVVHVEFGMMLDVYTSEVTSAFMFPEENQLA